MYVHIYTYIYYTHMYIYVYHVCEQCHMPACAVGFRNNQSVEDL